MGSESAQTRPNIWSAVWEGDQLLSRLENQSNWIPNCISTIQKCIQLAGSQKLYLTLTQGWLIISIYLKYTSSVWTGNCFMRSITKTRTFSSLSKKQTNKRNRMWNLGMSWENSTFSHPICISNKGWCTNCGPVKGRCSEVSEYLTTRCHIYGCVCHHCSHPAGCECWQQGKWGVAGATRRLEQVPPACEFSKEGK